MIDSIQNQSDLTIIGISLNEKNRYYDICHKAHISVKLLDITNIYWSREY